MYSEKIKHFQQMYPVKDCISGIITKPVSTIMLGTPCIAVISPFVMRDISSSLNKFNTNMKYRHSISAGVGTDMGRTEEAVDAREEVEVAEVEVASDDSHTAPDQPRLIDHNDYNERGAAQISRQPSAKKRAKDKSPYSMAPKGKSISISELSDKKPCEIDKILSINVGRVKLVLPFCIDAPPNDYYEKVVNPNVFACSNRIHIIHDKGSHMLLERLSDVHNKDELASFSTIINDRLREARYVNYTFTGIAKSNIKYMMEDLNRMYNALRKTYENHTCVYMYENGRSRALVDTLSISFYNLYDMIPIFDSKRAKGVGIEISLTNSIFKGIELTDANLAITYRFILAAHRENIFTIDGEKINRLLDISSSKALTHLSKVLFAEAPNDTRLQKKKAAIIQEDHLCAE